MGEIEYLVVEIEYAYGKHSYYASGYGTFLSESSLLDRLGLDGWELVSSSGSQMRFKRVEADNVYDGNDYQYGNNTDYSAELERVISVMSTGFLAIGQQLEELKSREMILTGLLQALVEEFCPDSEFLQSLKAEMGMADAPLTVADSPEESVEAEPVANSGNYASEPSDISAVKTENAGSDSVFLSNEYQRSDEHESIENTFDRNHPVIRTRIIELADEYVNNALENYKEEDCSISFMAMFVSDEKLLEPCSMRCQEIIAALYRFYDKNNQDERIKECYIHTLQEMALYFSCYEDITLLQQSANYLTPSYGAAVFFESLLAELKNEYEVKSPFRIATIPDIINKYVTQLKRDSELSKDYNLLAEVKGYVAKIQQQYNITCDNV